MAALRMRTLYFCPVVSIFFFFFSPNLSGRTGDVDHTSTQWCGLSANLECRSKMCSMRLAGNTGRKNDAKNRHLRTIPQIYQVYIFATKGCIDNRKNLTKQQYLLHMSAQYRELRRNSG